MKFSATEQCLQAVLVAVLCACAMPSFAADAEADSYPQPEQSPSFTAPVQSPSPTHSYSQVATNEFLKTIYAIIDYNSLMNPQFLENAFGVKFDVFPENYGPEKEFSLSRFHFSARKSQFPAGDGDMSINYRVYVSGYDVRATLEVGFDIQNVCISEDAFDKSFHSKKVRFQKSMMDPFYSYKYSGYDISKFDRIHFSFGVDRESKCVTWFDLVQNAK